MKVIILAAGKGSSLGGFFDQLPKCLLPIGRETILERQMRMLGHQGIDHKDIVIVIGHLHGLVEENFPGQTVYNPEYQHTDNAYSLYLALQNIDDDVLIMDGDLVFEEKALECILSSSDNAILVKKSTIDHYGSTGVCVRGEMVEKIGKHIQTALVYESMIYLKREYVKLWVHELSNPENFRTWYTVSLNQLLHAIPIKMVCTNAKIEDIDTYFDYLEAKQSFGIEDFSILITGASGLLGNKIYHILKRRYKVTGLKNKSDSNEFVPLDLTDERKVEAYIELHHPKIVIHAAGIADPEICDQDRFLARESNVHTVQNLVNACKRYYIKIIHISTDYVFDGEKESAYQYDDERHPKNYYGQIKKEAEDIVRAYKNSLIVRIPILYGYNGDHDKMTFPIKVIQSLQQGSPLCLDNQQIRYPVLIDEAALSIEHALSKEGIIHIASPLPCTKYTWAKIIAKSFGLDSSLIRKSTRVLHNRPRHVKLHVSERDYCVSDVKKGVEILKKQIHCVFRLIYKSSATSFELGENVGNYRYHLGRLLGNSLDRHVIDDLDYVVPVPSSGLYYAMGLAAAIHVPYLQGLVKPDAHIRSFQLADLVLREQTIKKKIVPIVDLVRGKNIALVDEAIFTGITLKVICDMMKACGSGRVYICIPTPVCHYQCQQYVQPDRRLLSEEVDAKHLKDYFGIEGVYFQQYDRFYQSMKKIRHVCYDCFAQ